MKKVTLKPNGTLEHVWLSGNAPEGALNVSDNVFKSLINNPQTRAYIDGELVDVVIPFNFNASLELKVSELIAAYKQAMSPIKANYTDEDIASFPTQEAEAKAWDADNNVPTPLLDYMLANRPTVDKATLVSRILQNAVIYKQIAGPAIGKKQHLEDQLYALKAQNEDPEQPDATQADIDAIVVDFSTN